MISCPPNLFISDIQGEEGDTGSAVLNFLISLSAPAPLGGVQVSFSTSDGSATISDVDYQASSGSIIIPEDQTSGNIPIQVNGDTKIEPDESFLVNLSNVVNAIISDGQGIGTIQNDDVDSDGDGVLDKAVTVKTLQTLSKKISIQMVWVTHATQMMTTIP